MAVWSSWGLFIRGLDMPVAAIAFYNAFFALIFQGAGLFYVGRRRNLELMRELGALVLLALFGLANLLFFFHALKATTVAGALLTHYTAPVFVALLAPLMLRDRSTRAALYALCLSAAGLVLIFSAGGAGGAAGGEDGLWGLAAGTASGLAYAFVIIISRGISSRHHPMKVIFVQGAVSVAGIGLWMAPSGIAMPSAGQALVFAVLGLMHSTLAVMIYLYGIRRVSAQEAGVLGYLEPVLAILLAFLFLGETPGSLAIAGGLLILLSGSMVIFYGAPQYAGGLDDNRG